MTFHPSSPWRLSCTECGRAYEERAVRYVCPACAVLQEPGGATRGVLEVVWEPSALRDGWRHALGVADRIGLERFRSLLPVGQAAPRIPLVVGDTPTLDVPRLRSRLGMPRLFVKDETRNPSASYKDRASALVCMKAAEYGEQTIVAASTGNAATALACIAASLGQRAVILVPASAPPAKLVQMLSYGAEVLPVDGTYDQAFELSLEATRRFGWYNRNTAFNPFTIEGKKTSAFEMVLALGRAPDVVVVPTGDGVIVSGVAKGFRDMLAAGAIDRLPRLVAVQAEGSASIARALRSGGPLETTANAHTVADSICVAAPRAGLLAVREVRRSGGAGVMVSDDAIVESIGELARYAAVFTEPAGAAAHAGLLAALAQGLVSPGENVVLLVTGHGLKDIASASKGIRMPPPIPADVEALNQAVRDGATDGPEQR